jgi:hypothetical protein
VALPVALLHHQAMLASMQPADNSSSSTSDAMYASVLPPRTPVSNSGLRTAASVTTAWDSPPLSPVHKRSRGTAAALDNADGSEFSDSLLDMSAADDSVSNNSDVVGKLHYLSCLLEVVTHLHVHWHLCTVSVLLNASGLLTNNCNSAVYQLRYALLSWPAAARVEHTLNVFLVYSTISLILQETCPVNHSLPTAATACSVLPLLLLQAQSSCH